MDAFWAVKLWSQTTRSSFECDLLGKWEEHGENMQTPLRPDGGFKPCTFSLWGSSANQLATALPWFELIIVIFNNYCCYFLFVYLFIFYISRPLIKPAVGSWGAQHNISKNIFVTVTPQDATNNPLASLVGFLVTFIEDVAWVRF